MKLKKLTMKAFGSYGAETVIDFDDINSGLYLIRGNTGAGKTTIFDAVVFALYGESSGGKRTLAMMHSDFVDFKVPTEIELSFEHNGGVHTVRRKQAFRRHKDDGSYSAYPAEAVFLESGKPAIEKSSNVTNRISELLGLNAEQFSQIVMLAQGDFRKFLEANSEGRRDILSRIFDTTAYKAVAERLDRARAKLEAVRARDEEAARMQIQDMKLPEDIPAETLAKLKPVDQKDGRVLRSPTFEEDLSAWIAEENVKAAELESIRAACAAERERLMEAKTAAECQNQRLDELDDVRRQFEELKSRTAEMDEMSAKHDRGVHALAVRIEEEKLQKAENTVAEARVRLDDLDRREKVCAEAALKAAQAADSCGDDRAAAEIQGNQLAQLRSTLPDYRRLSETAGMFQTFEAMACGLTEKADEHRAVVNKITSQLESAAAEIAELGEVDAEAERARAARIEAETLCRRLSEICDDVALAQRDSAVITADRNSLQDLNENALREQDAYNIKYHSFISGQAALLAADLHRQIEENGEARCPVCGVLHKRDGGTLVIAGNGAEKNCTQEEVDEAKAKAEEADQQRRALDSKIRTADALLQQKREGIVKTARELPACENITWDELSSADTLCTRSKEYAENLNMCHGAEREARRKAARKTELQRMIDNLTLQRQREDHDERTAREEAAQATARCEGLRATVDTLRGKLTFDNEKQALAEIDSQSAALKALKEKISAIDQAKTDADKNLTEIKAKKTSATGELERAEGLLASCRSDFAAVLEREGYADKDKYRSDAALLPKGMAEAQRMLAALANEDATYRERCMATARRLSELEKETESFVRRDLAEAETAYNQATEREAEAADRYANYAGIIADQKNVLGRIGKISARLRGTDGAMNRIKSLSRLANGDQGTGADRLDFERFMLGDCLREVLYQANARLDKMSGGRYELVHRSSGRDRQKAAGLDIDVLDHNTGRQRLAETISGGEGFQASMALALGLADVVRNRAGNVQLDSTFIDEGFGSLDEDVLRKCLEVLKDLADGDRQVGIISHVAELESNVWPQIVVTSSDKNGSSARIEKR